MKIHKGFKIILILSAQFFSENVLILQNVLIAPKSILLEFQARDPSELVYPCLSNKLINKPFQRRI